MLTLRKSKMAWVVIAAMSASCFNCVAKAEDGVGTVSQAPATDNHPIKSMTVNSDKTITFRRTGTITPAGAPASGTGQLVFRYQPQMIKAAFLGIEPSEADATLRAQLKLPEGVGLAVHHVMDQSPAQAAGVQEHDVLYKLNDQLLINPAQYMVLVRTFKPGDKVELTVIREAQQRKLTATLIEKEVEAFAGNGTVNNIMIDGNSPALYNLTNIQPSSGGPPFISGGTLSGTVNITGPGQGTDFVPAPAPAAAPSK